MDFKALCAAVVSEYNGIAAAESLIKEKVNIVYRDLAKLFTFGTVEEDNSLIVLEGQEVYTLPSDSREIKNIYLVNGEKVRLRQIKEQARLWPRPEGMPKRWFAYGMGEVSNNNKQRFGLDPVPKDIEGSLMLAVFYEPFVADLVNDTDKPQYIPEENQYLIVWGAAGILAAWQEDYNASQNFEIRYREGYNVLMQELGISGKSNYAVKGS